MRFRLRPRGYFCTRWPAPGADFFSEAGAGIPASSASAGVRCRKVLARRAREAGAVIRLGVEATGFDDDGNRVRVNFKDGSVADYHLVIGADVLAPTRAATCSRMCPHPRSPARACGATTFRANRDSMRFRPMKAPWAWGWCLLAYLYVTSPEPVIRVLSRARDWRRQCATG